ncbi:MAG: PIG-L family deacetylase [Patescibacteria group bacterium]
MTPKDSFPEIFNGIDKVLVVLAHPDDMEVNCGGLIARLTEESKNVRLIATTNGGKGTKDKKINEEAFGATRVNEQIRAGEILGIPQSQNFNLQIPDGELETDLKTIEKIVWHIREFKPNIVITHNPEDLIIRFFNKSTWVNHRDHRNTAEATLDAIYPYSRDANFFPQQLSKDKLTGHKVTKVLVTDSYTKHELRYFDIGNYLEKKKLALQQHVSAFSPEDAKDYIEENRIGDGYFEPLAFYTVY